MGKPTDFYPIILDAHQLAIIIAALRAHPEPDADIESDIGEQYTISPNLLADLLSTAEGQEPEELGFERTH